MNEQKRGTPLRQQVAFQERKTSEGSPRTVYHAEPEKSSDAGLFHFIVGLVMGTLAGLLICAVIMCSIGAAENRLRETVRRETGAVVLMEGGRR